MRLGSGKITKKDVIKSKRRYVRKMATPKNNNNGEQPSNNTWVGTIIASSTEPVASIASTTVISSMTVTPYIEQEGIIFFPLP